MARLLYLEDDPRDFETYADPLVIDYGWEVDRAENPDEALKKLANGAYDVILIDRRMKNPRTGQMELLGDGLLEIVIARWHYVCPIVFTVIDDVKAAQRATRYGAYRYIVKGLSIGELDRACRKGMQWQLVRRIRHRLLTALSTDAVIAEVKARVKQILQPPGYCFAYLRLEARGALLIGDCECTATSGPLAKAVQENGAFLADFPVTKEVVDTSRFVLKNTRTDIAIEQGALLENPGSQLIVPVLSPNDDLLKHAPAQVSALIWVESLEEDAFDRDDADTFRSLPTMWGLFWRRPTK